MNKVKCRYCKQYIDKEGSFKVPLGYFCNIEHAQAHGQAKAKVESIKQAKRQLVKRKAKIKTLSEHKKELQTIFNRFIRLRDEKEPCISCQRHHNGQYHCGHYLTVGARPNLRFTELNCHKQCAPCNNHLSGNLINYRINLIKKIGLDKVEQLERNYEPLKLTISQCVELKSVYREKVRELEKALEQSA